MEPLSPRSSEPNIHDIVSTWVVPDIAACRTFVSAFNESKKSVTKLYQINGEWKEFRLYKLAFSVPMRVDVDVDSTNSKVHRGVHFVPSRDYPEYEGPIKRIETYRVVLKEDREFSVLLPILKKLGEYCERIANEVESHSKSIVEMLGGYDSKYVKWEFDQMLQHCSVCSPMELLAEDLRKELEKSRNNNSNV